MRVSIAAATILLIALCGCDDKKDPSAFIGTFQGDGVVLRFKERGGKLRGLIRLRDKDYPAVATYATDDANGKFKVGDELFDFEVTVRGDELSLRSGGTTYSLQRVDADNPLARTEVPDNDVDDGSGDPPRAEESQDDETEVAVADTAKDASKVATAKSDTGEKSKVPPPDLVEPKKTASPPADAAKKAEPVEAKPKGFTGTFRGTFEGTTATLTLKQAGSTLTGSVGAEGETIRLRGTVTGSSASGQLITPDGQLPFQAALSASGVRLSFGGMSFDFRRAGAGGSSGKVAGATSKAPTAANPGARNQALVGTWSRTDSISSGGASMSTQYFMRIHGNGTYEVGTGRSAGGGAGWSASGGGGVQVTARGQWKTQGAIVHINEGAGWQPYARFYRQGNKLMFTFGNGNREIWYRN